MTDWVCKRCGCTHWAVVAPDGYCCGGRGCDVPNWKPPIVSDPEVLGGAPVFRGTRIAVDHIKSLLARGETPDDILKDYPDLKPENLYHARIYEGEQ